MLLRRPPAYPRPPHWAGLVSRRRLDWWPLWQANIRPLAPWQPHPRHDRPAGGEYWL